MSWNRDLTLDEVLADPMIGAALRADRVDHRQFETLLRTAARKLGDGRDRAPRAAAAFLAARCRRPAAGDLCAW